MRLASSLPLRSSNEVSSSVHPCEKREKPESTVPHGNRVSPAGELVHLKVPKPLRRGKQSSILDFPTVYRGKRKQGSSRKKKTRSIGSVTVPHFASGNLHSGERPGCYDRTKTRYPPGREVLLCDESNPGLRARNHPPECTFQLDDEARLTEIPSVKPWTPEELDQLNRRYSTWQDKIKMAAEIEKLHKITKMTKDKLKVFTPNAVFCQVPSKYLRDDSWSVNEELFYDCDVVCSKTNLHSDQERVGSKHSKTKGYKGKLLEVHKAELGVKR